MLAIQKSAKHSEKSQQTKVKIRVRTGQGKLEKVRELEWSGKVREYAKVTGKSGKFGVKFYLFVQLL